MTVVPLHVHSGYSPLDGYSQPIEIAHAVKDLGCPCCGLTDHGTVAGHLEFFKALTSVGVKPIPGIELYHGTKWSGFKGNERDQSHLILLSKTTEGLRNIWRLSSAASAPEQYRWQPRATSDQIVKFKEGIVATSACALGLVPKGMIKGDNSWLDFYLDTFGDNFYIELSSYTPDKPFGELDLDGEILNTRKINLGLVELGLERGVEFTIGDDAHHARKEDYPFFDAYIALSTGQTVFTPIEERKMWHPNTLYIKGEDELRETLSYLPQAVLDNAIANTVKIGEESNVELPGVERRMPIFVPSDCPWLAKDEERSAGEVFIDLVQEGILERYPAAGEAIWDRVFYEVETFLESGLEHMFLMDWDKNQFCDTMGILRGPGRGSAAGSIVAYALGITDVDPMHYDLFFERFWNPGRAKGFPDIDGDHERDRRHEIITYLVDRWNRANVSLIGTVTRMKPKAALERMQKAYGITDEEVGALKRMVGEVPDIDILGSDSIGWSKEVDPDFVLGGKARTVYVMEHVGDDIEEWLDSREAYRRKYLKIYLEAVGKICNRPEGFGIHPSGVVISPVPLDCELPTGPRGTKENRRPATEFPMNDVDGRLFVKLDVLGLKTLDTLAEWLKEIKLKGVDLDWSGLDKEEWPLEMWQLLWDGFSAGIFQIEGGYASHIAKGFKPRSVLDLSIIVALNRPGPIRSGAPDSFITRRNGEEDDLFDGRKIPMLQPILEETYGWFLYQEQVIQFFSKLGYDLSDADAVRKILGKKKPEEMAALAAGTGEWALADGADSLVFSPLDAEGEPISGLDIVVSSKGYKEVAYPQLGKETADEIWAKLVEFAKYSFNKAHSVAYGIIGFRCLLAKFYAAPEFYMACIRTVEQGKKAKLIPTYINEARRMGIIVHPPDIERSQAEVAVWEDGDIYWGFSDVKNVATGGAYVVVARDELDAPVETPDALFEWIEAAANDVKKQRAKWRKDGTPFNPKEKTPKQMLGENKIQALYTAGAWERLEGYKTPLHELQNREKEALSVILSDDTADILVRNQSKIEDYDCDSYAEALAPYESDRLWHLPGTVIAIDEKTVKTGDNKGKSMGIITIEYMGDTIDFPVFSKQWRTHSFLWRERTTALWTLRQGLNNRTGEPGFSFKEGTKLS